MPFTLEELKAGSTTAPENDSGAFTLDELKSSPSPEQKRTGNGEGFSLAELKGEDPNKLHVTEDEVRDAVGRLKKDSEVITAMDKDPAEYTSYKNFDERDADLRKVALYMSRNKSKEIQGEMDKRDNTTMLESAGTGVANAIGAPVLGMSQIVTRFMPNGPDKFLNKKFNAAYEKDVDEVRQANPGVFTVGEVAGGLIPVTPGIPGVVTGGLKKIALSAGEGALIAGGYSGIVGAGEEAKDDRSTLKSIFQSGAANGIEGAKYGVLFGGALSGLGEVSAVMSRKAALAKELDLAGGEESLAHSVSKEAGPREASPGLEFSQEWKDVVKNEAAKEVPATADTFSLEELQYAAEKPAEGPEASGAVEPVSKPSEGEKLPIALTRDEAVNLSAGAPVEKDVFILANDGKTVDLGEIHPDVEAKSDGKFPPAPIRLQEGEVGKEGFGRAHIAGSAEKAKKIENMGYGNEVDFVQAVARDHDQVWEQPNGRLLLVKKNGGEKVAVVELKPSPDDKFYGVTSAYPASAGYAARGERKLLWDRAAYPAKESGAPSPYITPEAVNPELPGVGARTKAEQQNVAPSPNPVKMEGDGEIQAAGPANSGNSFTSTTLNGPVTVGSVKSFSQITRDLSEGLSVPIRYGMLPGPGGGRRRGAGGFFAPKADYIGVDKVGDMRVVTHEVGHKLDKTFNLAGLKPFESELLYLGDNKRPGSSSSWTPTKSTKYRLGEGVAEFTRYWLNDRKLAEKMAPNFTKHFEELLDKNVDVGNVMRTAQQDLAVWKAAPAQARIRAQISNSNPTGVRFAWTKEKNQLVTDWVDDLHALRVARDEAVLNRGSDLKPTKDPYLLARLTRGDEGKAQVFLTHGIVDFHTQKVSGKGLESILSPVRERLDDFTDYLVARRARELHARGIETGFARDDVNRTMDLLDATHPDFKKVFAEVREWQSNVLKYAVDSGLVSPKSAVLMTAMNRDYVPFKRVYEMGAGEMPEGGAGGGGRGMASGGSGLKKIKGSSREVINPLETMVANTYQMIHASEKYAVTRAVADLAREPGMGKWVETVSAPMTMRKISVDRIRAQLEQLGVDMKGVDVNEIVNYFESGGPEPYGKNVIRVMNGDKEEYYRLNGELYRALKAMDVERAPTWAKMLGGFAQILRSGATLYPDFVGSNLMRDTVTNGVIARYGYKPFATSINGLRKILGDDVLTRWQAAGGENAIEASYFDRDKLQKHIREGVTKDLTRADRAMFWLKSPMTALRKLSTMSEQVSRVGYFEKVYTDAIKRGLSDGDAARLAAYESRDLLDFAKSGARSKSLNMIAAFYNSQVQGLARLAEAFKEKPIETSVRAGTFIMAPTVMLYMVNRDNQDYWDRPQWERDLFWLIPSGKDDRGRSEFIKIPKPFELGVVFGTLPERILANVDKHDPKAMEGIASRILSTVTPKPIPTAAMPVVEVAANKNFFLDRPVVPTRLENTPPEYQFTEQTSLTAKKIGKMFGMSPLQIEQVLYGYTSSMGRFMIRDFADPAVEAFTGDKSTSKTIIPGSRFFTSPAGSNSEALARFYDELKTLRVEKKRLEITGNTSADMNRLKGMEQAENDMSYLRKMKGYSDESKQKEEIDLLIRDIARFYTPETGGRAGELSVDDRRQVAQYVSLAKALDKQETARKKELVRSFSERMRR
jgi:hypothetical protein